jgi:hypothetical protein
MQLPLYLHEQLIPVIAEFKEASRIFEERVPSFGEWYSYASQNPQTPSYLVQNKVTIPIEIRALVERYWQAQNSLSEQIQKLANLGYDYAIYIMPLLDTA